MKHEAVAASHAVERYVLGEMSSDEREAFEEHFFECRECAEDVQAASLFVANARAALADEAPRNLAKNKSPADRWDWLWFLRPAWGAALAGILAVVAGYQSFVRIPALQSQLAAVSAPRQVTAQYLRPETRGDVLAVPYHPGEPLLLTFDIPPAPAHSRFLAEIVQDGNNSPVHAVPVNSLSEDQPASIFLPAPKLRPGRCIVVLYTSKGGQRDTRIAQYPFELQAR
jgi:hypothetical protein